MARIARGGSIVVAAYPLLLIGLRFYDRRGLAFVRRLSRVEVSDRATWPGGTAGAAMERFDLVGYLGF
jgi:hypothetical protein